MKEENIYQELTKRLVSEKLPNKNQYSVMIFCATWSGNAEIMNRVIERVYKKVSLPIDFFKVDVENQKSLAAFFGVHKVPTIVMVKEGEIVEKVEGFVSVNKLKNKLKEVFYP